MPPAVRRPVTRTDHAALVISIAVPAGALRPALNGERELVRQWRNHPQVRAVSLTRHEIGAREHERWWSAVHDDPDRRLLVYEWHGRPSGVVVLAGLAEPVTTWSFYLDIEGLEASGELLPAWLELERRAVAYAFDELELRGLGGETLADNTTVLALHRRFGFRETRRYQRDVDGQACEVVWTQLLREERTR